MPEQTDIYISDFPDAESITNVDKVTGLQGNANKNFTFSSILAWFVNAVKSAFVPVNRTVNGKTLDTNITLTASDVGARPDTWTPSAADIGAQEEITASGILKGDGAGGVSAATAGTDYATPAQLDGKANQAQLATEETGSTASRAYDVGEYFCWNGLFYRVIQPISNGGTFTPGTNCVTDTVGERLGLIKTVLCATGTSSNPVNTVIPLKNSHTYLVMIQRVGDQYSSFGLIVQSNGTVWKNDLASGGAYSNRYSVSTGTRTLTITAYLSAVIASIIDFGAYA